MIKKNNRVALVGIGAMGTALAQTLLENEIEIHVWNRTPEKIETLAQKGAITYTQPHKAIESCDIVIVCLSDYDAWKEIIDYENVRSSLKSSILIQLSTGSMAEVEANSLIMKDLDVELIEGSILCFPEQIGTELASIILAGKSDVIESCNSILRLMSPKISYLGESLSAPVVLGNAIMSSVLGFSAGLINGAALCLKGDVPLKSFREQTVHNFARMQTEPLRILDAIANKDTENTQASVSTWYDAHLKLLKISDKLGVDTRFHQGLSLMFKETIDQNIGGHDLSAMVKVFSNKN